MLKAVTAGHTHLQTGDGVWAPSGMVASARLPALVLRRLLPSVAVPPALPPAMPAAASFSVRRSRARSALQLQPIMMSIGT